MDSLNTLSIDQLSTFTQAVIYKYASNFIFALLLLLIGLKASSLIATRLEKTLAHKNIDASLGHFLSSLCSWVLKAAVVISSIKTLGFETTSFVAILGSVGLAIGLALQGSLSNLAGGVLILLLKPFKVGDFIKVQGIAGTIVKITTFYTELKTGDNQLIIMPNGSLSNSTITNVNANTQRRVDFVFSIGYEDNIKEAKELIASYFDSDERILKDPKFTITVGELADSSVNLNARAWVMTPDYWSVYNDGLEKIKLTFDKHGISIPFPQRDIHLYKRPLE